MPPKCINRVGVFINNPSATQFSYKLEFILCKIWRTFYKDIKTQLLDVHWVVWSVFPGIVLSFCCTNVKIKFYVFSSYHEISETKQKWGTRIELHFKDKLAEYYTVCLNKCILKSFKFLANSLDIHFIWTHCIFMTIF